jgi:hypothetical protein
MAYHISEKGPNVREAVSGGSSVYIDLRTGGEIEYVEVMKNPKWRKSVHSQFPETFKKIVFLLLLSRKQKDSWFRNIPEGIFFQMVEETSKGYEARTPLTSTVNPIQPKNNQKVKKSEKMRSVLF